MHKSRVVLHGGFGNQLFQWAYGHFLQSKGSQIDYVFIDKDYLIEHTKKSLGTVLSDCEHGTFIFEQISQNRVLRILGDPTNRFNPLSKFYSYLVDSTDDPFNFETSKSRNHLGYYQNAKMISIMEETIYFHLVTDLYKIQLSPLEERLQGQEIVHIRQGDTKTIHNIQKIGVLDRNYYLSLPPKLTNARYVLTDDPEGARVILEGIDVDGIFGPKHVDAVSALRIMGNASILFTANSTLSWWGGFLAIHRGGRVFIPKPFFLNVNPDPKDAFHYPGFNELPSSFLKSARGTEF
jgi:hypothetical protein